MSIIETEEGDYGAYDRPQKLEEYLEWLSLDLDIDIGSEEKSNYEYISQEIKQDFINSNAWKNIEKNLKEYEAVYKSKEGYQLFQDNEPKSPEILVKDYSDFLDKTLRKNVINNPNWPDPPEEGWITPENWFSRVTDIVRFCFVVKYLDGVKYIADILIEEFSKDGYEYKINYEAKDEGYYAAHLNIYKNYEIDELISSSRNMYISIEIQITTQLQELIKKLLHTHYENKRSSFVIDPNDKDSWKWNYECDEFATNYLGHILHYIEGMIMDIRKREKKND